MKKMILSVLTVFMCCLAISISAAAMTQDSYESNNTKSTATAISAGTIQANLHSTSDVDYYKFTTTETNRAATIQLTPSSQTGLTNSQLKIQVTSPSGETAYSNVGGTGKRRVGFACISTGTYYIKVYGNTNASGRAYSLNLSISSPNVQTWVETIEQEQANWCWAACAEMVGEAYWRPLNNYSKPYRDVTQTQIVQKVHGNTLDKPASTIKEAALALDYALDITSDICGTSSSPYSASTIFKRIWTLHQPIMIRVGNSNSASAGHFIVIKGIDIDEDGTFVDIVDPGDGAVLSVNYDTLKNSGYRPSDNRRWTYTVVINKQVK